MCGSFWLKSTRGGEKLLNFSRKFNLKRAVTDEKNFLSVSFIYFLTSLRFQRFQNFKAN